MKILINLLLVLYMLIALTTVSDYGLTWDEEVQKNYGDHVPQP